MSIATSSIAVEGPRLSRPAAPPSRYDRYIKGLRLLIVADSSTTHTHRWAHWFRDRGSIVTVLSHVGDPIEGVRVVPFPGERRWYHRVPKARVLLDYPRFQRMLREVDPQLIHFHFVSEGGRAFYWNKIKVPMVASTWGQDVIFDTGAPPWAEKSLRTMLSGCSLVTATTHQLAEATARYTLDSKAIFVIPFGVDLRRFPLRDHPQGATENPETITLGFVKHLLPKYGPDVLVEAFALINKARPKTKLVMAGRGTMREQLERRIAALGLQQAVQVLGRVAHEQVPALVRSFDIMVMPSIYHSETFGVAAIEASASGVPVVASRVGGVPEAVVHEKTGLLVPPGDAKALADACIDLIDEPARRRAMGMAGRKFVERNYVWQDNCVLMEEIYRAALEGDAPRGVPVYRPGSAPDLEAQW